MNSAFELPWSTTEYRKLDIMFAFFGLSLSPLFITLGTLPWFQVPRMAMGERQRAKFTSPGMS